MPWTINNEEYQISTYGSHHGIPISAKQNDILASREALWGQLKWNKGLKENFTSIQRAKSTIRATSFSLLDMNSKQLANGKSMINILNNLQGCSITETR